MTPDPTLAKIASSLPETTPNWPRLDTSRSLRDAAKAAADVGTEGVVLTEQDKPVAIVWVRDLLLALSLDTDSVTGLPRSGPLRDWLGDRLREGVEVSVIFLDLDAFGEMNRAYGHTEGDLALARAADAIKAACSDQEFPARYGGDEFAIGSLKNRDGAKALTSAIRAALRAKDLPASAGVSGGRRSEVREGTNLGVTVEELLRLASLDCMESKGSRRQSDT